MDKFDHDILAEAMYANYLKESGTTSSDVGQYAPLILPLVQKIYPDSLVSQIASVQPTTSPVAKISSLFSIYTGQGSNNDNDIHIDGNSTPPTWSNSKIITVPVSAGALITVGSSGASGANRITVFYTEGASAGPVYITPGASGYPDYTNILVRVDAGNIVTEKDYKLAKEIDLI
jgi:hypothetical protein